MVSQKYLDKIRFTVRRNANERVDEELTTMIEQCRADLIRIGVHPSVAEDEENKLVLGCQRAFVRWQYEQGPYEEYALQADSLRKSKEGRGYDE